MAFEPMPLRALRNTVNAKHGGEAARYLAVVIGGFVIDLSISWTTHELLGVNLVLAAALGFLVAMCLSYFAHEFWTFRSRDSAYSAARLGKFAAASGLTLGARLALVWLSAPLGVLPFGSLIRLLFAFGGSLVVGFLVNRLLVFGARAETAD
jgi:putative flippase GtrA